MQHKVPETKGWPSCGVESPPFQRGLVHWINFPVSFCPRTALLGITAFPLQARAHLFLGWSDRWRGEGQVLEGFLRKPGQDSAIS